MRKTLLALVGDSGAGYRPEAAQEAIEHACAARAIAAEHRLFESTEVATASGIAELSRFDGIWVVPGSPYRSLSGILAAIKLAREEGIPLLGTCAGFQHLVLEYFRTVLGFRTAVHAEYGEGAEAVISRLSCSLVGRTETVMFRPGSKLAQIYGAVQAQEQFRCNYGVSRDFIPALSGSDLKIAGRDVNHEVRAVELRTHPFFVGTLFIPQYSSAPGTPHPLVCAFLTAATKHVAQRSGRPLLLN